MIRNFCRFTQRSFLRSVGTIILCLSLITIYSFSHLALLQSGRKIYDNIHSRGILWKIALQNKYIDTWVKDSTLSEEVRHIAFLKVHKSASTTAQNIFLRFGATRNLTFVIPVKPAFLYPNIISTTTSVNGKNILPPPKNKSYDILCCHVIYNHTAFRSIMPKDTVNIGIVREPFDQFVSVLQYFQPKYIFRYNSSNIVSDYLKRPLRFEHGNPKFSFTNNRMAFEYGFPLNLFRSRNATEIQKYLEKLDEEFRLVIVVEYFDESLVLMRRYLNWNLKDIMYIKQNARVGALSSRIRFNLEDRERYRKWGSLDYALYEYFYNRLWQRIREEGSEFENEVMYFRRIRKRIQDFCLSRLNVPFIIEKSKWNENFNITKYDCNLMLKFEIHFVEELSARQYPALKQNDYQKNNNIQHHPGAQSVVSPQVQPLVAQMQPPKAQVQPPIGRQSYSQLKPLYGGVTPLKTDTSNFQPNIEQQRTSLQSQRTSLQSQRTSLQLERGKPATAHKLPFQPNYMIKNFNTQKDIEQMTVSNMAQRTLTHTSVENEYDEDDEMNQSINSPKGETNIQTESAKQIKGSIENRNN